MHNKLGASGARSQSDQIGEELVGNIAKYMLSDLDKPAGSEAFAQCYRHDKMCPVQPHVAGHKWHVMGAGVICVDWTGMGSRKGWCGPSVLCFMIFLHEMLVVAPDAVILECVLAFDSHTLGRLVEGSYDLSVHLISPHSLGLPAHRPRKYMFLMRRGKLVWHPAVQRQGVGQAFDKLFCDEVRLHGEVYFSAPQTYADKMIAEMAEQRGFPRSNAPHARGPPALGRHSK